MTRRKRLRKAQDSILRVPPGGIPGTPQKLMDGFAEVSNPYFNYDHAESASNPSKIVVRRVDDLLDGLLARKQIDQAQFEAGRKWQKYHERAEIGGARAIDTTKEAVDGGRIPEPITDLQIEAIRQLQKAHKYIGPRDTDLVYVVLGNGKSIYEVSVMWACEARYVGQRFRHALESLAKFWCFA